MRKKDRFFILLLFLSILFVFFDLFTLDQSFLSGDHREQQYPWAKFYQESIRDFHLPWWTNQIHCGFPLLAEGQIGAFYPLNFLFLFFLPLKWAYNYQVLFQYLLGAVFFYVYLRRRQLSEWASLFATLVFLFGSTQGGYFYYNLISQKVVIWLPLTLILIDRILERRSFWDAFFLSLVFAIEIFGGYLQVAIYAVLYSCFYFVYFWFPKRDAKSFSLFALSGLLGIFFSLVQLLPTLELSLLSTRAAAERGLAYVGSMTPAGFVTLLYPSWDGFLGSELYVGILALFFVLVSGFSRKGQAERFFWWASLLFLLLALGKFSPLYVAIVESTGFNAFRTPIKFLFFVAFSLAVAAGFGFDKIKNNVTVHPFFWGFAGFFSALSIALPLFAEGLLRTFRTGLLGFLQQYVRDHIYGQAGHPHSLEHYLEKAAFFYDQVVQTVGFQNRETWTEWWLLAATVLVILWLVRFGVKRKAWQLTCCLFLFFDLCLYGFVSIKANYEPFDSIDSRESRSAIVDYLQSDKSLFRVMEVLEEPSEHGKFPVFPSFNMLYKIQDIGAYSPLVMRAYREYLRGWGYTNDSLWIHWVHREEVLRHTKELNLLNVKYLLSLKELDHENLTPMFEVGGVILYRNDSVLPRAFFLPGVSQLNSLADVRDFQPVSIRRYEEGRVEIEYEASEGGLLVLTDIAYPNWTLFHNGVASSWQKGGGLFRTVRLEKGSHDLIFEYQPRLFQTLGMAAAMVAVLLLVICGIRGLAGVKKKVRENSSVPSEAPIPV